MRSYRHLLAGVLTSLPFLICPLASNAAEWQPITAEELKLTSVPQQPGAPAVVLYHEERDDDKIHVQQIYERLKILTDAGKEYANVEIPYDRNTWTINSVKARTIQADGAITNFDGKVFDRIVEKGAGRKIKVKSFILPNVQVGSIIEYSYSRNYPDNIVMQPRWVLQGPLFRKKEYFSYVPTDKPVVLAHDSIGNGISYTFQGPKGSEPQNRQGKIEMSMVDVPPFLEEPYMPPTNMLVYNVHFYYDLHRGKLQDFWREETKFWNKDVERFLGKRNGVAEAVSTLVAPTDTAEQKARKIYAFVQTLRNLDYSPRLSAEEAKTLAVKNNKGAEDVLRQKLGDSEEITRLYVAMMRQAGVPAYVARITSRDDNFFDEYYLSFDQLDHELAIVQLESGEIRLDPGTRFCPFGMLYWKNTATKGYRQTASGKPELINTAALDFQKAWTKRTANLWLKEDGTLAGTVTIVYMDQEALKLRLGNWQSDAEGKKKVLEDEIKEMLPAGAEVELTNKPDWEGNGDLIASFQVTSPAATSTGHRVLLPIDVLTATQRPMFAHNDRRWAVCFNHPIRVSDSISIVLPAGVSVESVPPDTKQQLSYAFYSVVHQSNGNVLQIQREFALAGNVFPKDYYTELKGFYDQVKTGDDQQIVLSAGRRSAANAGN